MAKSFFRAKRHRVFSAARWLRRFFLLLGMLGLGLGGGLFLRGRVISVADGDSLVFFTAQGERQRVRLYGIDAPEGRQRGGEAAADFARSRALFAEAEITVMDRDQYGRAVALVSLPEGGTLNEEMIRTGHAWVYDRYCHRPQCAEWRALEKQARLDKKGLWADKNPQPPWVWRKKHR